MITPQLSIIELFSERFERELTINQIGKLLHRPYASVNKYVHELVASGVLVKKQIGSALLCSLDYGCEETIAMLLVLSIQRRLNTLHKIDERRRKRYTHCTELSDSSTINPLLIYAMYAQGNKISIVTDLPKKEFKDIPASIVSKKEFQNQIRNLDYRTTVVLKNHEQFWRMVAEVHQR